MKELKKGDLVMTEHGWGLYGYVRVGGVTHRVDLLDGSQDVLCEKAEPKTRAEVEAYLKEKGWESFVKTDNIGSGYYRKDDWDIELYKNEWIVNTPVLFPEDFDTAPAMQAEAILMAKLLNATKYN